MTEFVVTLPSLGEDAGDKARVSFVYVGVGDSVAAEADLIEMVTDKATFNVPCPKAGVIKSFLASEGDEVSVGGSICILTV